MRDHASWWASIVFNELIADQMRLCLLLPCFPDLTKRTILFPKPT
jgi:hypothetical protein